MLAPLVVALLVEASASPTPSAAPPQPLRTVVYHVSITLLDQESMERYHGLITPRSVTGDQGGTLTIDVMARAGDTLGVRVTEEFKERGYPAIFAGNVGPQGVVNFADDTVTNATRDLLRYFGIRFASGHSLESGETWNTQGGSFTVHSVAAPLVTLNSLERYQVPNSLSTLTVRGSVEYDPGLLLPVRGRIERRQTETRAEGSLESIETITFERSSDSFDRPAPR